MIARRPFPGTDRHKRAPRSENAKMVRERAQGSDLRRTMCARKRAVGDHRWYVVDPSGQYTHCGKYFRVNRQSIRHISSLSQILGGDARNEENAHVIDNLHGGVVERRAGSGGTSNGTNAAFRSRDDAPLAAAQGPGRKPGASLYT
jgi:hypothetical protein